MKAFKLLIVYIAVTVVMVVSWVIGTMTGNAVTQTTPPVPQDAASAGLAFLAVCAFNSVLTTLLLFTTEHYRGWRKRISLILFVFVVQFLLPQMETFFFASDIGISYAQAMAIVIAGVISSTITVFVAILVYSGLVKLDKQVATLNVQFPRPVKVLPVLALLIFIGYPFLYLTFGYYVAWQSESLRVFYTSSSELASFGHQVGDAFANGIYPFQVLRALIWIAATTPVVIMLRGSGMRQFLVIAILTSLLPTSLLFIPNPYMPTDIAMTHFVETSTSNFLWGLMMVAGIKKMLAV